MALGGVAENDVADAVHVLCWRNQPDLSSQGKARGSGVSPEVVSGRHVPIRLGGLWQSIAFRSTGSPLFLPRKLRVVSHPLGSHKASVTAACEPKVVEKQTRLSEI